MSNWTDAEQKSIAEFEQMGFDDQIAEALTGRGVPPSNIGSMTKTEILRHVAAWHLGDGEWADTFRDWIDQIREMKKGESK